MPEIVIRSAHLADQQQIAQLCAQLWPDATAEEHAQDLVPSLAGTPKTLLPHRIFVAETADKQIIGFVEVDLRSHADGCDYTRPVGFLEGWLVSEKYRRQGIAARLLQAAEDWARQQGCKEIASDTWLDHTVSQQTHEALGFEEVDRCIHYRKAL